MNECQVRAVVRVEHELLQDLDPRYLLDYLLDCNVLTEDDKESIMSAGCDASDGVNGDVRDLVVYKRASSFLAIIMSKGGNAFKCFIEALLNDDAYPWLAEKLEVALKQEEMLDKHQSPAKRHNRPTFTAGVPFGIKNLLERPAIVEKIRAALVEIASEGRGWVVVHGMVGAGKTVLASEAVREWPESVFEDGIYWLLVGCEVNESKLLLKMQELCERIEPERHFPPSVEMAANRISQFVKRHPKTLIVLDDVWGEKCIRALDVGCPILMTTQEKNVADFVGGVIKYVCTDDGLTLAEGKQLLSLWVKSDVDDLPSDDVKRICDRFRGNPLCLTMIGSLMEPHGNESGRWSFYRVNIDDGSYPRMRRVSGNTEVGTNSTSLVESVRVRFDALDDKTRDYYKDFALFANDIKIPIKVFELLWDMKRMEVEDILSDLFNKSLVLRDETHNGQLLYMVHDLLLDFLRKEVESKKETEKLHMRLLKKYFRVCQSSETEPCDYSKLPEDDYIYYFIGYHLNKARANGFYPEIFLDLSFVEKKLKLCGPSDLLNDFYAYSDKFEYHKEAREDFVNFLRTNAHLLCDPHVDVIQLALCQPIDSIVHKKALELARSSRHKWYFRWCNQSNVKSSKLLSTKLHEDSCNCAAFSPKAQVVVSVGQDKVVRVWDCYSGKPLHVFRGHEEAINWCQFNKSGDFVVTASDDGMVKLWQFNELLFNGKKTNGPGTPRPRSGSYPFIFNGNSHYDESHYTLVHHPSGEGQVNCCSFSSNEEYIVSGGSRGVAIVWKFSQDLGAIKYRLSGHGENTITSCQFSSDDRFIATCAADTVVLWSSSNGSETHRLVHKDSNLRCCVFNGNNLYSAGDRFVWTWDFKGKLVHKYSNFKKEYSVTCCTSSPNGQYVVAGTSERSVVVWRKSTRDTVATLRGHNGQVVSLAFNKDGSWLLSTSDDGTVLIWDFSKPFGTSMVALCRQFAVQFHSTPERLTVASPDEMGAIQIFQGLNGKSVKKVAPLMDTVVEITCCALTSDACNILFGTREGSLFLHEILVKNCITLEKHDKEVTCCSFSDDNFKFVSGSSDGSLRIYDRFTRQYNKPNLVMGPVVGLKMFSRGTKILVWTQTQLYVFRVRDCHLLTLSDNRNGGHFICADVTPNEELIASVATDKTLVLWRTFGVADKPPAKINNNGNNRSHAIYRKRLDSTLRSCRFDPNGHFLVAGDDEGRVGILDLVKTTFTLFDDDSHPNWVNHILVSPNGLTIVTVGDSIKWWDKKGRKVLQTFETRGSSMSLIFASPQFDTFVTVDDAGVLYVLEVIAASSHL